MIITSRLVLKKHDRLYTSLEREIGWLSDEKVTKYSEQRHKDHSFTSQLEYINSFKPYDHYYQIWLGEKHIGSVSAYVDPPNRVADMGIMIGDRSEWGKGYGLEAWRGLMSILLSISMRKLEAGCMETNEAMQSIFDRSGLHYEGLRKNHFIGGESLIFYGKAYEPSA